MKRIPKLLLTLILLIGPVQPTFATIEERGTTWWTVDELLEFNQEVEAEKDAECGDNKGCRMEFDFNMIEKGPKYNALNNLLEAQIWVTSVNPATETIKVLFFDDEMMLKHMGIEEKIHPEHLYIGWIENWTGQIYSYNHEQFTDGSMPGNHVMYDGSLLTNGPDWIPAWEEYEISVAGSNLTENTHGKIDFAIYAEDNMFNAQGYFDYSDCLNSPDYQEGMECKMYVSGDQWVSFFPPREQISQQDNLGQILLAENTEQETATDNTEPGFGSSNSEPIQSLTPTTDNPKAPETGANTNSHESSTQMPWWYAVLGITGIMLIVWWLLPTKSEKIRKKSEKTRKKVLTKQAKCDKMGTV